ncbi:methyl-accepting chemotaxis protein [Cohnella sp.]|uniref:methyl-accepting chemotaxis protein n=1 Tax=Cohnella sp. TaxID=1883426 RepID=UPI00356748D4
MKLKIRIKVLIAFIVICCTILAASLIIIQEFNFLEDESIEAINKNAPLVLAGLEIKQSATEAHLWLEEVLSGAEGKETYTKVLGLIDQSLWYADAILVGGALAEGTIDEIRFYAVSDEIVRRNVTEVKQLLTQFKDMSQIRYDNEFNGGTVDAQLLDDQFDQMFEILIKAADESKILLIQHISANMDAIEKEAKQGRYIIVASIIVIFFIVLAVGVLFWKMLRNIHSLIRQVNTSADQLASSAFELTASADITSDATEHIASTIDKVAVGTEKQVRSVEKSSKATNEMSVGVQQIAVIAGLVSNASIVASAKAAQGNTAIQTAVQKINSISLTVNGLAVTVKGLGERSNDIGQITEAITDIAEQTNILALNAAIEAARAGQHGSGFAVVAGEVRRLAELSARASQEIAQLIANIQEETSKVVQTMENATTEVAEGIGVVNSAGESFEEIQRSVNEMAIRIEEVSSSVQKVSVGTEQVVQSIRLIAQVAEETASGSQSVSSSAEEQLATMEDISSSASSLSGMADKLRMLIGKFNV